jgi:predicted enzyme related to lactoylglutathione lyase
MGGSIVTGEGYNPSINGILIYLNGGNDLSDPLKRIEKAGRRVLSKKNPMVKMGLWLLLRILKETGWLCIHQINKQVLSLQIEFD